MGRVIWGFFFWMVNYNGNTLSQRSTQNLPHLVPPFGINQRMLYVARCDLFSRIVSSCNWKQASIIVLYGKSWGSFLFSNENWSSNPRSRPTHKNRIEVFCKCGRTHDTMVSPKRAMCPSNSLFNGFFGWLWERNPLV